ncbi:MAG: hypothetical protein DME70_08825, partial [Verrucomicrobia bacterium]
MDANPRFAAFFCLSRKKWQLIWAVKFPSLLVLFSIGLAFSRVNAATAQFVVRNTNDDGAASLRQAIVNANSHPNDQGPDFISFAIPGSGVQTIVLESALPAITEPVIIDGWTQPGWDGAPLIELTPAAGVTVDGLTITGGGTTIRGLVMNRFLTAINFSQNGNNIVQGCYLGTDTTGTLPASNRNGIFSLQISNIQIGGTTAEERNIISGNRFEGIKLSENDSVHGIETGGHVIQGNYVGTDVTGTKAVPNCTETANGAAGLSGIYVIGNGVKIGGPETGTGNLVSGNASGGISLEGAGAIIAGNFVGTDITGFIALPNNGTGLSMASLGGQLGGLGASRNLVSGNARNGIGVASSNGFIQGNYVGTDITGKVALPNGGIGMSIAGRSNLIGGSTPGAGNLIS